MTFSPANRASPSSRTWLMTWLWRAVPKSFRASKERMAQPAGIISEPGKPPGPRMRSKGTAARPGRKRNRPPNWVRKARGAQVELADVGDVGRRGRASRAGRSSSRRRGRRAKPSP